MKARKIVLGKHFKGAPKLTDFSIVEEDLPELKNGQFLCKAEWLTVDPYMRPATLKMNEGDQMPGGQVARVIESKASEFPVGTQVVGNFGWRDLTIATFLPVEKRTVQTYHAMPEMKGLPDSYALGCMGMPGNTAYFGVTKVLEAKKGETLVVTAAAGAVGSLVGQIGKALGLTVIGYAGSDDKVEWLKTLGFDYAINYKTQNIPMSLNLAAKKGVDCYFDNVGGQFTCDVMAKMNFNSKIALCGAISVYNGIEVGKPASVPFDYMSMIYKNIKMQGFIVFAFAKEWMTGINAMRDWILAGKIKVEETKYTGFEQMPQAFIDLLAGKNTGKVVIQA